MKKTLNLLTLLCLVAAVAGAQKMKYVDVETEMPVGLEPIGQNLRDIETRQKETLERRGKTIAALSEKLAKSPGNRAIEAELYQAKSALANDVFVSEAEMAGQYNAAADRTREMARRIVPCVARPEILQQREFARRKLEKLTAEVDATQKNGLTDEQSVARAQQPVQQVGDAAQLLGTLDKAEEEQKQRCLVQTRQLESLNTWADDLSLKADLHLLRGAQAAMDSLVALIHLQTIADRQRTEDVGNAVKSLGKADFNAVHELERILKEKQ